jgi:hypothetical protein
MQKMVDKIFGCMRISIFPDGTLQMKPWGISFGMGQSFLTQY